MTMKISIILFRLEGVIMSYSHSSRFEGRREVELREAAVGEDFDRIVLSLAVITTVLKIKLHERKCQSQLYVNLAVFQH